MNVFIAAYIKILIPNDIKHCPRLRKRKRGRVNE